MGAYTQVIVSGGVGGSATVVIRFCNGYTNNRSLGLYLNGVRLRQVVFAPTGGWNTFANTTPISLTLAAGNNALRLQRDSADKAAADIDRFVVTRNY